MKFPIPIKILLWLFANIALLAVGFWMVFRIQFGGASNDIFGGIAEPRVQALAERIGADLRAVPRDSWAGIIDRHQQDQAAQITLYDADLRYMHGPDDALPEILVKSIRDKLAPVNPNAPGGPDREGPPGRPQRQVVDEVLDFLPPVPERAPPRGRAPPPIVPSMSRYPKIAIHTGNPSAYWVVIATPVVETRGGYHPVLLVIRSASITGGGLFFDPKPWLLAGFGALFVSVLLWMPLALGLTRSLSRIKSATARIADGDFNVRVPEAARADEMGELGTSVNQLAGRLDGFVQGQKRFLGDIAHELCSPIARMQAAIAIIEQQAARGEDQTRYLTRLDSELQEMSRLVNELLSFSKATLKHEAQLKPVALEECVRKAAERERSDGTEIKLNVPSQLQVEAEPELLERAVGNVLRNAVRYAGEAGPIEVRANRTNGKVRMSISDRGPGVKEADLSRLFDAFYRPDSSRNRNTGGVGLGLAIVKSCIENCGGSVTARNRVEGGLEVTIELAAATAAS